MSANVSTIEQRRAYLRELERKKRLRYGGQPAQGTAQNAGPAKLPTPTATASPSVQQPQTAQQAKTPQSAKATQKKAATQKKKQKQAQPLASLADMLKSNGATVERQNNDIANSRANKPNVEYLRDPATGKARNDISLPDLLLLMRQTDPKQRPFTDADFDNGVFKTRSSPYFDPYYTKDYTSNDDLAKSLFKRNTFDDAFFADPENLKLLDGLEWNRSNMTPKAPTKKSSLAYQKGYKFYYMMEDHDLYKKAMSELPALYSQVKDIVTANPDMSEDDILKQIDWRAEGDDGNQALSAINQYRNAAAQRTYKFTSGGGLFIGDESLKAAIRAAKRGEDISQVKDYLYEDVSKRFGDMVGQRDEGQVSAATEQAPTAQNDFGSNLSRIRNALGALGNKAIQATADAIRQGASVLPKPDQVLHAGGVADYAIKNGLVPSVQPDPEQLKAQKQAEFEKALNQSISTTGKIDLRDTSIPQSQWPFLIQANLASQDQANAILEQQKQQQAVAVDKDNGMVQGSAKAQASSGQRSGMSASELAAYRDTLVKQRDALNQAEQNRQNQLPAIEQEIAELENEQQYAADPASVNARLQELYQQRADLVGSADEQAARKAEALQLDNEIDAANKGLDELRSSAAAKVQQQTGGPVPKTQAAKSEPAPTSTVPQETQEQYIKRLSSTRIDDLIKQNNDIRTLGEDARSKYIDLQNQIDADNSVIGDMPLETIQAGAQEHPERVAAYADREQALADQKKLSDQMAAQGIDITDGDRFNMTEMRKAQEANDAAVIQYSSLQGTMTDFAQFSAKGETLSNPKMDASGIFSLGGKNALPDMIQNPAVFAKDNASNIAAAMTAEHMDVDVSMLGMLHEMAYMSDDEVKTYSYLLANPLFGKEKADLYYQGLRPYLAQREGKEFADKYLKDHPFRSIGYGAIQGYGSAFQGMAQLFSRDALETTPGEYAGMYAGQYMDNVGAQTPIGSVGRLAYNLAYAGGNMVPSILAQAVVPGAGIGTILTSAGGNYYRQSIQEGHTPDEAFRRGVLGGLSEAFMEKLLGVGAVGGGTLAKMVGAKTANLMTGAFTDAMKGLAATMASNGTEEYLQDVISPVLDKLAYGGEFQKIDWTDPQAVQDGVLGALTAVIVDSPEILGKINGVRELGANFNTPKDLSAMVVAGQNAPEAKARENADQANQKIMQKGGKLDSYRAGKLALSMLNSDDATAMYGALVNPDLGIPEPKVENAPAENKAPETADNRPPEVVSPEKQENPTLDEVELTQEEKDLVDATAKQVAYDATQDEKQYPPALARLTERVAWCKQTISDSLQKQLDAVSRFEELMKKNADILSDVANGIADAGSVLKTVANNVKEIAKAKAEAEAHQSDYNNASAELPSVLADQAKAIGELHDQVYAREVEERTALAKQAAMKALSDAKIAAQQEADRKASEARLLEVDARLKDLDEQDKALAANEEPARQAALDALAAENKAMAAPKEGEGAVSNEDIEKASKYARSARDNYTGIQRQRREIAQEREQFAKERAELTDKIGKASASVKAEQLAMPEEKSANMEQAPVLEAKPIEAGETNTAAVENADSSVSDAPENEAPKEKIKRLLKTPFKTEKVNPSDLKVDPEAYQFKGGADESGVTKPITGDYSPLFIGDILVHRLKDGTMYVADGHHRREFALRKGVGSLDATILEESDGITAENARVLAAARNLSQGRGTPVDAAKVFRNAGIEKGDLANLGLSESESIVEKGLAIASLIDDYYKRVVSGDMDEFLGVLMGKTFPNDERMQRGYMKLTGPNRGKLSHNELTELARGMTEASEVVGGAGQIDMFADYDTNMLAMARIAAGVKQKLAQTHSLFKKLSSVKRKEMVESVGGNALDTGANLSEAQRTKIAEGLMGNYFMKGELHDFMDPLATQVKRTGKGIDAAINQVYDYVIERATSGGEKANEQGPNSGRGGPNPVVAETGRSKRPRKSGMGEGTPTDSGTHSLRAGAAGSLRVGQEVDQYVPTGNNGQVRRASAVAHDLYEAMGVKYTAKNQPRTLSRKDVALYEDHPGIVVTRTFQNVAAYAHELGHAIFDRAGAFDGLGEPTSEFERDINEMVRNLPAGFAQYYTAEELPQEAAAEFVRNYLTDRNAAINFAGQDFVDRFEKDILDRKELRAMNRARYEFNVLQDSEMRNIVDNYRAMIVPFGEDKPVKGAEGNFGAFAQGFADRYYAVNLFDIAANKLGYKNSDPSKRAYIMFSNIPYSFTQASNLVSIALADPNGRYVSHPLKDVLHPISMENAHDFDVYLTALHDIDRQAQGKPVFGQYDAETSRMVADRLAAEHPEFVTVQQNLVNWWNDFIDEWVAKPNAFEDAEAKIDHFRELYPNYVPTFRSKQDAVDTMTEELGDMGGLLGQASVHFQRAKGGDAAIKSPIQAMVMRMGEIVTGTNKVLAMRRIHEAYQATSGLGDWIREVPESEAKANGNGKDELLRIIDEDGNVHHYQVMDKLLYDSLLKQTTKDDGGLWKAVGALTGAFKQVTTQNNPFFAFSNALRDYGEALVKGSNPNPLTFTGQWLRAIYRLGTAREGHMADSLKTYYGMGGGDSNLAPKDRQSVRDIERTLYSKYFRDSLRRIVSGDSFKERVRGGADALSATASRIKEVINAFNNVIEGSQRYAEFDRTLKRTGDASYAMYASTNVTTDFRRSGNWDGVHKAGLMFAFMNAGIQGAYSWYKIGREAQFNRKEFASKAIRAVVSWAILPVLAQALIRGLNDDDKEAYVLTASDIKANNFLIPKSIFGIKVEGGASEHFFKFPKPREFLATVGDAMGRAWIDTMQHEGSWDAFVNYGLKDYANSEAGALLEAINPYGSPVFAPALQILMNKTWYGSPIESQSMRDRNIAPVNRIKDNTSSMAILLAGLPGLRNRISPVQVDYLLNQSLGVVGDYVTGDIGNAILDKLEGRQVNYKPMSSTLSFIKSRIMTDPTAANEVTSSMYDASGLLQGIVADSKVTTEGSDPYGRLNRNLTDAERKAAVLEAKSLTKKGGALYRAGQSTTKHYKEIDAVNADDTLTEAQKIVKVREIKWQMLLENDAAYKVAEDYIRKYVKGTPELFARIYGKK